MQTLLHQPLVQFLILGLSLFAADFYMLEREDDPRRIVIDDARYAEIAGIFRDNQGREPTTQEMEKLTITWAQNEVLYREARLMGLDKGDEMIRNRLILKLRNVFFNRVEKPKATDETLAEWFEENRDRYDQPRSYDWEQVYLGEDVTAAEAQQLVSSLGQGEPTAALDSPVRSYSKRPKINFETIFGATGAEAMIGAGSEQWVPVQSSRGWHAARITRDYAPVAAVFDQLKTRVRREWEKETMDRELRSSMAAMASAYEIRMALSDDVRSLTLDDPSSADRDAKLALSNEAVGQ